MLDWVKAKIWHLGLVIFRFILLPLMQIQFSLAIDKNTPEEYGQMSPKNRTVFVCFDCEIPN